MVQLLQEVRVMTDDGYCWCGEKAVTKNRLGLPVCDEHYGDSESTSKDEKCPSCGEPYYDRRMLNAFDPSVVPEGGRTCRWKNEIITHRPEEFDKKTEEQKNNGP